mmetsp:Transcript_2677/g.3944  ORF Transcript_2677/g.3944 Transcript_2677/m.3944 type:complete len:143 (-) Transcript_2677:2776-3204(-)
MKINRRVRNKFSKSKYKVTCGIFILSKIKCTDNSGAKKMIVFGVFKSGSRLNRIRGACPGSMIVGSVKKGKQSLRKQILSAIIVRQKKPWRRFEGDVVSFEDNSCILTTLKGDLKGTNISGPVARESAWVWPRISIAAQGVL